METIKPQELRIGNLLDRNGIMEVLGIGANNKLVIYDHYNKERLPYGLDVESFKGIAITPEWLEKFGFMKEVSESYASGSSVKFDVYRKDKLTYNTIQNQWWYGPVLDAPLRYVHQLQNLCFALTGQELTKI